MKGKVCFWVFVLILVGALGLPADIPAASLTIVQQFDVAASGIAVDADDVIWFTNGYQKHIGRINPSTGEVDTFPVPHQYASPGAVIVDDFGDIWVTALPVRDGGYRPGHLYRFHPDTETFDDYVINQRWWNGYAGSIFVNNYGLAKGPDGRIWFNDKAGNPPHIGFFDPLTNNFSIFNAKPDDKWMWSGSSDIAVNSFGDVWYNNIWRYEGLFHFDEATAAFTYSGFDSVYDMDADGFGNIWFTYPKNNIGRIDRYGSIQTYPVSGGTSYLNHIDTDSKGIVWFKDHNRIFRFDPQNEEFTVYTVPYYIAWGTIYVDDKDRIWLTLHNGGIIQISINTPPTADAGPDRTIECAGPGGTTVTLDGSGSTDPDGDALTYSWTWDGGTASGVGPTITLPLGTTTVTLTVDDGNGGTSTDTVDVTVRDTTPPATSAIFDGVMGNNGWYVSDVVVTLTSTDGCSGVKEIRYTLDGNAAAVNGGQAVFTISTDGLHGLSFNAKDNAGNTESVTAVTVNIDKTDPVITAVIEPPANTNGWHNTDVTVSFTCTDAASGIAECPQPIVVTTEGAGQIITGTAVDNAGNTATTSVTLNIDKTSPVITATVEPPANQNGWHNTDVTVTFTCTDEMSGVATCPEDVSVTAEGAGQVITGTTKDKAGNAATTSVTLDVDKTVPVITATVSLPANENGWNNEDVTVTFECSDSLSGIASCTQPIGVTAEGAGQVITGTAVDKAGNTATTSVTLNIDKTSPEANISVTPGLLWPPNHKKVNVAVNGGANDPASGVASVEFTVTDEYGRVEPVISGFNTTIPLEAWRNGGDKDGRHYTITAVITDNAGNTTTVATEAVVPHDIRGKK